MNIFIATLLLFVLVTSIGWVYDKEPNQLFLISYPILCTFLSKHTALTEHPFVDVEAALTAIIFCLLGHFNEIYYRVIKKLKTTFWSTESLLKGFTIGAAIVYVTSFVLFANNSVLMLFMFVSSAIALVLVFLIERCFRYLYQKNSEPNSI